MIYANGKSGGQSVFGSGEVIGAPEVRSRSRSKQLASCAVNELRLHPSLLQLQIAPSIKQRATAAEQRDNNIEEPFTISQDRFILAEQARWELAQRRGEERVSCLELNLTEEEGLFWIVRNDQRSDGMCDFDRIRLALRLEEWFRVSAQKNQVLGGQNKVSSNLAKADKTDVQAQVASAAGISTGNVTNVKRLLELAKPEVIDALRSEEISIHRASQWVETPDRQIDELELYRSQKLLTPRINALLNAHNKSAVSRREKGGCGDLALVAQRLSRLPAPKEQSVLSPRLTYAGDVLFISTALMDLAEAGNCCSE